MPRILIVEDEPAISESLAYALKRDGFEVSQAGTLIAARAILASAELVLLDLMLPDGSGFDILHEARRAARGPAVIILSSRDHESDRVAALETGADDYVTKPFSPREVVARVRAVLRRAGARDPSVREPTSEPPITVDEPTRRAAVRGRAIELTRVEFDLLACLLSAPGRVFTRAQLIDRVWGDGFAITDRTIDSHVKALRRKVLEAGGDAGLIETVRGVGYRASDQPDG
ncbi:MAG: response regulator transcription factor [Polyangiaceae bacterium]|nr:response regulator transcription factor [Polyangiaceae bacterium]MBK8938686.1 response regulator transcription factor [Polyangiaceae bacterium]